MGSIVNRIVFPAHPSSYSEQSIQLHHHHAKIYDLKSSKSERRIFYVWMPYLSKDFPDRLEPRYILYFHGNAEDVGQSMPFLNRLQAELKAHIFAVEYPGYGFSIGMDKTGPDADLIKQDSLDVYAHIHQRLGISHDDILVFGRSIGSGPAFHLAGTYLQVKNLLLLSPLQSMKKFSYFAPEWFDNEERIRNTKARLLVVHGKIDTVVPVAHGRALVQVRVAQTQAYNQKNEVKAKWKEPQEMDHNNIEDFTKEISEGIIGCFTQWTRQKEGGLSEVELKNRMEKFQMQ